MCSSAIPLTPTKHSVKCVLSLDLQSRFRNDFTSVMLGRPRNATRQCAALSGARIAKKTKLLGNRMQQDNAQPSAAHALPRKRNVELSDATKTLRSPQPVCIATQRHSSAIGCNKTMRSPQRRTHCHKSEIPRQSDPKETSFTYETSFTMREATIHTLRPQQILRLPRKMNLMHDPHHIWSVIYHARSNSQHPPTSPNTAPATQYESHDWSASHMKRHLQCAEQQSTPSNVTKYCACHAIWISWLIRITYETSFTMRGATVHTLRPQQILRLPRKMNLMLDPHHLWNVIYNARSNSQHPPTSPNTAPATQNESHDWSASHMKRHLQCAEQQSTPSNLTKYCACHAKWPSNIWEKLPENSWNVISNARPIRPWSETDPTMIRAWSENDPTINSPTATRRATEATFHTRQEQILLKITTFRAPTISPNFTKCCACHEKWHLNFIKCCACHEKWHLNFTKCCACHEKWHLNLTKCCACHEKCYYYYC